MQRSTWNLMLELGNYVSPELARSRKTKKTGRTGLKKILIKVELFRHH